MNFIEISKEKGLTPSFARKQIYNYLNNNNTHLSADQIYVVLKRDIPSLSKTTVYNVLRSFKEKGIVSDLNINSNEIVYELKKIPHAHFKCTVCGEISDLPLNDVEVNFDKLSNYKIEKIDILIYGVCPHCRNK